MIGNRDPSASVYLGYDVKQFDIQQAIERNLRNSSKKLLNMNESRKMINVRQWEQTPNGQAVNPLARSYKEQINDPSSHFERNVKRYTYDGAAMSQGQNLDILRASKNLSHIKREQAMDWDLQKPRDSALYHISVTQNLKQLDQQLVAEMGAAEVVAAPLCLGFFLALSRSSSSPRMRMPTWIKRHRAASDAAIPARARQR